MKTKILKRKIVGGILVILGFFMAIPDNAERGPSIVCNLILGYSVYKCPQKIVNYLIVIGLSLCLIGGLLLVDSIRRKNINNLNQP